MELERSDNKVFNESKARGIMKQLLEVLTFLHQRHLTHQDIKLDNILLDEDHNIKLIDFEFVVHQRDFARRKRKFLTIIKENVIAL